MALRRRVLWCEQQVAQVFALVKGALWFRIATGTSGRWTRLIGRMPSLRIEGTMTAGDHLRLRSVVRRSSISVAAGATLRIGHDVGINQGCVIHCERAITIGDRVDIGDECRILDSNMHPTRPGHATVVRPVVIEDDVWLTSRVTVLPGVTIGRGSVVAAGAVVTASVPPGSLVAGPAATVIDSFAVPQDFRRVEPRRLPWMRRRDG